MIISLQLAIYFHLHRGNIQQKAARWQACEGVLLEGAPPPFHSLRRSTSLNLCPGVVRRICASVSSGFDGSFIASAPAFV